MITLTGLVLLAVARLIDLVVDNAEVGEPHIERWRTVVVLLGFGGLGCLLLAAAVLVVRYLP